jgi:hypothetical protein
MKIRQKIILMLVSVVIFITFSGIVFAGSIPLKATWTPNTETDMTGYNLYRTDGVRIKINTILIPHPPTLPYLFTVTVPDQSAGTLIFMLTAVDTNGNESFDSLPASYNYNLDTIPPAKPGGLGISHQ